MKLVHVFLMVPGVVAALASGAALAAADKSCDQGKYSAADKIWLTSAAEGDHFEIAAARVALERGNSSVKLLGTRLLDDHTNALKSAEKVAQDLKIPLKDKPSPSQEWILNILQKPSIDFDPTFADLAVRDHHQDIEETQEAADSGCNAEVRKLARDSLPVLKKHLEMAEKINRSSSSSVSR